MYPGTGIRVPPSNENPVKIECNNYCFFLSERFKANKLLLSR